MTNETVVTKMPMENSLITVSGARLVAVTRGIDWAVGMVSNALVLISSITLLVLLGANVVARYAFQAGGIEWISEIPAQLFTRSAESRVGKECGSTGKFRRWPEH